MKFAGNYFYFIQSYDQAIRYYQKAEKELNENFHFKVEEEADLYYSISLTASKQKKWNFACCMEKWH